MQRNATADPDIIESGSPTDNVNYKLSLLELQDVSGSSLRRSMGYVPTNSASHVEARDPDYHRLSITPMRSSTVPSEEITEVCDLLLQVIKLREKYVYQPLKSTKSTSFILNKRNPRGPRATDDQPFDPWNLEFSPATEEIVKKVDGVFHVYLNEKDQFDNNPLTETPSLRQYFMDLNHILSIVSHGPCKTVCFKRLEILGAKYNLHMLLNETEEMAAAKRVPHRDFYNIRKVDTHIHHSAAMNQKHLLKFIKKTVRNHPEDKVIIRDEKELTLAEVFASLELNTYDLSVNTLDVHADKHTFHRFDKFNLKYNPCGQSRLREIFLKTDNYIKGRYLAELTKELFNDLEASKYQYAEYRLSVYGRKQNEFDQLASWIVDNQLFCKNVRWLIQIPRLYGEFKKNGMVENMEQVLDSHVDVFRPLFEATKDPKSHPKLSLFLQQVVGFDCVDDESKPVKRFTRKYPLPSEWDIVDNPPYAYYAFYLSANIKALNHYRESKGMNTFSFRPHAGEAGEIDHLASAFMVANGISHGINLRKSPVLQYLFYLSQIGIAVSPLSNNSLFLSYNRNPLPLFFARGLNVSLSTDDPLQFHYTREPLIEEYGIAAQVWKFTTTDQCEIARNSVLQSGFEHSTKLHWLGEDYWKEGPVSNDIGKTNVPNIRIHFRWQNLLEEMQFMVENIKEDDVSILTQRMDSKINFLN
ncbi:AMP deaminase [Planoprotostelium fungivorum]|uniref:AMP deaminase n=1 Tax=Planoprotostelium fungivorum TaxID=1890364 RepID=A0A2P6NCI7_9EUKA|nr:AMP deaminase [Planoprotostelium fungivorum]